MNTYKIAAVALIFAASMTANAFAQGAMSAPQSTMAAPAGSGMSMSGPKDGMAMDKPMAKKKKAMKKDAMKPDAMKSDSMMAPSH